MNFSFRYFYLPLFFTILLTILIQNNFFFSNDVGYLLHAANQLLLGEKYGQEIFETNPPMILYLYMPAVLFAQFSQLSIMTVMRYYTLALAIISSLICFLLLKKIFSKDLWNATILFYAVLFILFFLPSNEFSQREHFALMLILPYLFSTVLFLDRQPLPKPWAFFIGLAGGMGFAIKPYFLCSLVLVELYCIFKRRQLFGWLRMESITTLGVLVFYLASIFIWHPGYIKIILPIVHDLYFISIIQGWRDILFNDVTFWLIIPFVFYFLQKQQHQIFSTVLLFGTVGMTIAFIIPQAAWYYHAIPALGLGVIGLTYSCINFINEIKQKNQTSSRTYSIRTENYFLIAMLLLFFFIPLRYTFQRSEYFMWERTHGERYRLINYVNQLPHDSLVCYSVHMDCFPISYLTNKKFTGSFPLLWWMRGVMIQEKKLHGIQASVSLPQEKTVLIEKLADDLNKFKTQLVLINLEDGYGILSNFNYINYFSQNEKFKQAWKDYVYLTSIGYFQIYQRKEENHAR